MEVYKTDISKKTEFTRSGYNYRMIRNEGNKYVYKLTSIETGKPGGYEVVKGKKGKQPDGTIVYTYPGDEDFGTLGFYIMETQKNLPYIDWLMNSDDWSVEARYNFRQAHLK